MCVCKHILTKVYAYYNEAVRHGHLAYNHPKTLDAFHNVMPQRETEKERVRLDAIYSAMPQQREGEGQIGFLLDSQRVQPVQLVCSYHCWP